MYEVKEIAPKVYELHSYSMSFFKTKHSYWYYDFNTELRSYTGKQNEKPSIPMDVGTKLWAEKHYIPKAVKAY